MYYDALSRNTVKITLTSKDMKDYSIKSENLRSRTAESKRSLTCFLRRFQSESALFPNHKAERLFLEAFPSDDGGCIMYVSTLGTEASSDDCRSACIMCSSPCLDDIVGLCRSISGKVRSSSLYRLDSLYCLIIRASGSCTDFIYRAAAEYGELSDDRIDIAFALEHGTPVCPSNAVRSLAKL